MARPQCAWFGGLVARLGPACRRIGLLGLLALVLSGCVGATFGEDGETQGPYRKKWVLHTDQVVNSLAFSPDGRVLATGGGGVKFWDVKNGQLIREMKTHYKAGEIYAFSPDGLSLVTATVGNSPLPPGSVSHGFSVIDVATDKVRDVASPYGASATAVGFAPEGDVAVALYAPWEKGRFAVYDTKTWQVVRMFAVNREISSSKMALSPDNTHLAVKKAFGIMQLWNYRTGTLLREFKAHIGEIISFDFSHDGTFLAVTSFRKDENALTVWSVKNGDLIASKYPQVENGKWVDTLAFSRATERLAVRTKGGVTVFRDAQLNIEQEIITNHIWVTSIKFSPLSDYLAVSGSDRKGFYVPISTMIFFNNARSD